MTEITDYEIKVYKKRFLRFTVMISILFFLFLILIGKSFSSYVSDIDMTISSKSAIYVFEAGNESIDLDLEKIVPQADPYVYEITISNFNETQRSDVDIEYKVSLRTTTNLPLEYEIYRNQRPDTSGATNIISSNELVTDEDGSWYRELTIDNSYKFYYNTESTDTYYLVVYFPLVHSEGASYEGLMDSIEFSIVSQQIIT